MGPHKKSSETRGKSVKISGKQSAQVQIIESITMGKIHSRCSIRYTIRCSIRYYVKRNMQLSRC